MKLIVTGSLGHVGKPLTERLVQQGHAVTVISSKSEKQSAIEATGATAAIGSIDDTDFLTSVFTGADAAFIMVPPSFAQADQVAYYSKVGQSYGQAIRQSGIKRVVHMSSYGAHLEKGTGFIVGSHRVEQLLNELRDVAVTHIRPGFFYYNLFGFISMIKTAGFIGANYGGDDKLAMVAPVDIAAAVADELTTSPTSNNVRYVVSDDRTCREVAQVLGQVIGKPDLQWVTLTNEQMQHGLEANGVPTYIAANLVELGGATHSGILREDYDRQPPVRGTVRVSDFASEFAAAFQGQR